MDIAIIGAGAAGYFTAIRAAELCPDARVTLYEATGKTLSKLLISGGGRCNVTTSTRGARELSGFYPRGGRELLGPFSRFESKDTVSWFESRGVRLVAENDGRMFPVTNSSLTVANCLRSEAEKHGVSLQVHAAVERIRKREGDSLFECTLKKSKEQVMADCVVLTTGGARGGFALAASLGHTIVDPVPSLFSFEIRHGLLSGLQGVSFPRALLKLQCGGKSFTEDGPVLITHWGLSGPAIIRLSAKAARALAGTDYQGELTVNVLPELKTEGCHSELIEYKTQHPKQSIVLNCPFDIPQSFWERALEVAAVSGDTLYADFSKKQMRMLAELHTAGRFKVEGKGRFKEEFVTCGGVELSEVNFQTMESKICPGLFFAGEVLDIDGLTGGYNFQCAWTTGWLAAGGIEQKKHLM